MEWRPRTVTLGVNSVSWKWSARCGTTKFRGPTVVGSGVNQTKSVVLLGV